MKADAILVLGSTGKTGRRVAERLMARGAAVRRGSRSGTPPFDWMDRATWGPLLEGVKAVYISYFPDLAVDGAADDIQAFTRLAVQSGVRRLVLLSGRGETEARRCEDIVRESGVEWTLLRASWFAQNFSEAHFLEPILAGELALPVGDIGEPFVDADDIADVAVAALTEDGHAGQLYELTGSRLWTFGEAVAEIASATGRPIRFTRVTMRDYVAAMEAAQLPPDMIGLIRYLFAEVLDGRNASVQDGVVRAIGRRPREFGDYVRATAATGVWTPGGEGGV
ncbi:NAD(P)H-binding protein [Paraburkholderia caribensis]|uniref:NAD(P)H-binding protein n=1 Tax=Paraburkholderia caribensis TaxID=75105 RepID=A0A9Q6S453_9BURK|nr:NAD(P)H-binding protein [Paraburkholderia caribensis]MCO4877823.1 NAD(P)H-binding protein [Paraburkholderia caribensis]PTB24895.1 NmrA family transcriptional regulator [Paraburkholderia caribensis]QLB64191.1 NmrA family transcriptional regulator [Paraburkholderia caribensis]